MPYNLMVAMRKKTVFLGALSGAVLFYLVSYWIAPMFRPGLAQYGFPFVFKAESYFPSYVAFSNPYLLIADLVIWVIVGVLISFITERIRFRT
jgi:hypothetical protein